MQARTLGRVTRLEEQSRRYRRHHRDRTDTFVYGGGERAELFRRYVGGPGRRVLDVGCRYGALTRAYLEGNHVVGIDVDRLALDDAARLGIETQWADAEEGLPFEDASFDVVVAGELLQHVRDGGGPDAGCRPADRRSGFVRGQSRLGHDREIVRGTGPCSPVHWAG